MSFMCKIEVCPKREECKKGGWCTGCQKFFEVGPRREKCKKGGGCEKGGCKAVPHLGAKKNFRALRARTHLKKILNTPLVVSIIDFGLALKIMGKKSRILIHRALFRI